MSIEGFCLFAFQFLNGTIGVVLWGANPETPTIFQFLNGTIGVIGAFGQCLAMAYFNS